MEASDDDVVVAVRFDSRGAWLPASPVGALVADLHREIAALRLTQGANMIFKPHAKGTLAMTANASGNTVAIPGGGGGLVRLTNVGPQNCFFDFVSDANQPCAVPTTSVGGAALVANAPAEVFRLPVGATHLALVSGGNSTVYVSRGDAN